MNREKETKFERNEVAKFIQEMWRRMDRMERIGRKYSVRYSSYKLDAERAERYGYKWLKDKEGFFEKKILDEQSRKRIEEDKNARKLVDEYKVVEKPLAKADSVTYLGPVVSTLRELTPELVMYLQKNTQDLRSLSPQLFETLIAEVLLANGFSEAKLVGRDSYTSADICAIKSLSSLEGDVRVYVEVKRTRRRVGINIISQVLGAMTMERQRLGWHMAMIVSLEGFTKTKKYNRHELSLLGIELKSEDDIKEWLQGYTPNEKGLWLPD